MFKNASKTPRNRTSSRAVTVESLESRCLMSVTVPAGHLSHASMRRADAPAAVVQPAVHVQHHAAHAAPRHHGIAFKGLSLANHNQTLLRA